MHNNQPINELWTVQRLVRSIITYIEESEVASAGEYGGGEEWAEIKKGVADSNPCFDRHKGGVELHAEAEWAIEKIKENANDFSTDNEEEQ
jgi:hypothetical protein